MECLVEADRQCLVRSDWWLGKPKTLKCKMDTSGWMSWGYWFWTLRTYRTSPLFFSESQPLLPCWKMLQSPFSCKTSGASTRDIPTSSIDNKTNNSARNGQYMLAARGQEDYALKMLYKLVCMVLTKKYSCFCHWLLRVLNERGLNGRYLNK